VLKVLLTRIGKEILEKYKQHGTLKKVEDEVSLELGHHGDFIVRGGFYFELKFD